MASVAAEALEAQQEPLVSSLPPQQGKTRWVKLAVTVSGAFAVLCMAGGLVSSTGRSSTFSAMTHEVVRKDGCSDNGADCKDTKCCNDWGSTCFTKNDHWASCNATCDKHSLWDKENNMWTTTDEEHWSCRAAGCAKDGENCYDSRCCRDPDSKCYKKHAHWASCNKSCSPKMKWNHDSSVWEETADNVWDCMELPQCASHSGEDCRDSKCCKVPGHKCFLKHEWWAACNATCDEHSMWDGKQWVKTEHKVWNCSVLSHEKEEEKTDEGDGDGDGGDGGEEKTDQELADEQCRVEHAQKCEGCQGEQCSYCGWDWRIKCCQQDACYGSSGEQSELCMKDKLAECCKQEDVPETYGKCIVDGGEKPGAAEEAYVQCRADEDQVCKGCLNGKECSDCDMEGRFRCCLNKQCHDTEGDERTECRNTHKATCCTEESMPDGHWMCASGGGDGVSNGNQTGGGDGGSDGDSGNGNETGGGEGGSGGDGEGSGGDGGSSGNETGSGDGGSSDGNGEGAGNETGSGDGGSSGGDGGAGDETGSGDNAEEGEEDNEEEGGEDNAEEGGEDNAEEGGEDNTEEGGEDNAEEGGEDNTEEGGED